MKTPLDILLPYQRDWVDDDSRFKIGAWSRQTGKSFSTAAETVRDLVLRPTTWVTLSAGERQALEWMLKAREWAEAFDFALEDYREHRDGHSETLMKSAEIRWSNGSRLVAIPANPNTARGYSANLVLDEFAFHEQPDAIWRAIYPSISNPLKGVFKIRIVSTPNGLGNKFADLIAKGIPFDPATQIASGKWSKHLIDIYAAQRRGLPINIEELRAGLDDPDAWAQEYECQFLDAASILLPYELIAACESASATETIAQEYWEASMPEFPRVMGWDFARKKHLSVAWTADVVGPLLVTREVLVMQNLSTPAQLELLMPRMRQCRRVCIDYTGPGVGAGDYAVQELGEYRPQEDKWGRVELCTFTQQLKVDIFSALKMGFERREVQIPVSRAIREDLHSMQRVVTGSGNITYKAPQTDDGHADRITALALCKRAAGAGGYVGTFKAIRSRIGHALGMRRNREVLA